MEKGIYSESAVHLVGRLLLGSAGQSPIEGLLPGLLEGVPNARPCGDESRVAGIIAKSLTESGDSYLEDMSVPSVLASPDLCQELFMGDHPASIASEQTQDSIFGWR